MIRLKLYFLLLLGLALAYYFIFNYRKMRSIHFMFIDVVFYISFLVTAKALDLFARGRFIHHFNRYMAMIHGYVLYGAMAVLLLALILFFIFRRKIIETSRKFYAWLESRLDPVFLYIARNPEKSISIGLGLLFVSFLFMTFSSGGLFSIDDSHFRDSILLSGNSSLIVFVNFLLNLNNNLTILIWFSVFGLWYLFAKQHKEIYHYFFILVAIFFSQLILDWQYVRLYLNPIYAVYIALGIVVLFRWFTRRKHWIRVTATVVLIGIFSLHFIFSNAFMNRDVFMDVLGLEQSFERLPEPYYISAGEFLNTDTDNFSIMYTHQSVRYQRVAYYAKKPGAVMAQSIFIDDKPYNVTIITLDDVLEDIGNGNKIRQIFYLEDWIRGGNYYHGKHIYHLTINSFFGPHVKETLNEYNIDYIIDSDIAQDKFGFFDTVYSIKNKVYSNPRIDIYDLEQGRQ